ncbi:MAG TPA: hypothetical protein VK911_15895 [Vicinamibacterales bacterium]|nr:hypothetical protein [Vicinamibacterales bacterium]
MWDWLNCHLFGRHEHGIWCEDGTIYLRCLHCGSRSAGWEVSHSPAPIQARRARIQRATGPHRLELIARRGA